jgi:hypothetical protein
VFAFGTFQAASLRKGTKLQRLVPPTLDQMKKTTFPNKYRYTGLELRSHDCVDCCANPDSDQLDSSCNEPLCLALQYGASLSESDKSGEPFPFSRDASDVLNHPRQFLQIELELN